MNPPQNSIISTLAKMLAQNQQQSSTYVDKPYVAQMQGQRQQNAFEQAKQEDYYNKLRALAELRAQGTSPSAMFQKANNFVGDWVTGNNTQQMIENVALNTLPIEKLLMAIAPIASTLKLFHGTSSKSAKSILENGGFDLAKFGTGADLRFANGTHPMGGSAGFFGKGFYLAENASVAETYANARKSGLGKVIEVTADQSKIFDASNYDKIVSDVKEHWKNTLNEKRAINGKPPLPDEKINDEANWMFSLGKNDKQVIDAINDYAIKKGYSAVKHSPSEIVGFKNDFILGVK